MLAGCSGNNCYRMNLPLDKAHNHIYVIRELNQMHSKAPFVLTLFGSIIKSGDENFRVWKTEEWEVGERDF